MALGSSVYKMIFDTQGLESVTASRRELALQKKIMEETTPVIDKLAIAEANLDRLVKKDLITQEQRNAALSQVKTELTGTAESQSGFNTAVMNGIPVVGKYTSTFASLGPVGVAVAAALAGAAVAAKALSTAIHLVGDNVTEQIDKIDKLIEASDTIAVPVGQFQRLSHAANLANIEQSAFTGGMEKMLVGISKTADGTNKKLIPAFDLMRLDARQLIEMQPDQAFKSIVTAIDKSPNAADKARVSTAIFGSADFLRIKTEHLDRANSLLDRLRANIDKTDASVFGEFDANVKDMNQSLDVTWQKLAMEIVPALSDAAAAATEWLVALNQSKEFTATLQQIGDVLTVTVAVARELPAAIDTWLPSLDAFLLGLKSSHPIILSLLEAAQRTSKSIAGSNIAEQVSRENKLDAQRKSMMEKRKEEGRASQETAEPIERETAAISDLIDSLKEEIATRGMSAAAAKVWNLEQLNASEAVLAENRRKAAEYDSLSKSDKADQAVMAFTESLRHQGESAAETARRLADLKLANEGVEEDQRRFLMSLYDNNEAQKEKIETDKKAEAEARKQAEAVESLGQSIEKQTVKLQGYNAAIGDHDARLRAGERAVLEWQLAHDNAGSSIKESTLLHFDAATALEKRQKATEAALKAEQDLQKTIRQSGMTADQKQLDELKTAGVNDEQLKIIETLQKEAKLRGDIRQEITATSSAIKAGSREAADAFAQANQLAVRQNYLRQNPVSGEPVGMTATAPPAEPVITGSAPLPVTIVANTSTEPLDPFEEAYRLMDRPDPITQRSFDTSSLSQSEPIPMKTVTAKPPLPSIGQSTDEQQIKLQQKQVEHLAAIRNKEAITIVYEEVTL